MVVTGGGAAVNRVADDAGGAGLEAGAAAHHHGVQDHDLVPGHVEVQAMNGMVVV